MDDNKKLNLRLEDGTPSQFFDVLEEAARYMVSPPHRSGLYIFKVQYLNDDCAIVKATYGYPDNYIGKLPVFRPAEIAGFQTKQRGRAVHITGYYKPDKEYQAFFNRFFSLIVTEWPETDVDLGAADVMQTDTPAAEETIAPKDIAEWAEWWRPRAEAIDKAVNAAIPDWEKVLAAWIESRLPFSHQAIIPLPFVDVDSAIDTYAAKMDWEETLDVTIDCKNEKYRNRYVIYGGVDVSNPEFARGSNKKVLGEIVVRRISEQSSELMITTTGFDDNRLIPVVQTFLSNWMSERRWGRYWARPADSQADLSRAIEGEARKYGERGKETERKPWENIPDNGWNRKAVELLWAGHTDPDIARALGTGLVAKTVTNRLSELRQQFPEHVPTRAKIKQLNSNRNRE